MEGGAAPGGGQAHPQGRRDQDQGQQIPVNGIGQPGQLTGLSVAASAAAA